MSCAPIASATSPQLRLAALADELRADAVNGSHPDHDAWDVRRFGQLREIAAELLSFVDARDARQLGEILAQDSPPRTPLLGVTILFNHQTNGLTLVRDQTAGTVGAAYQLVPPDTDHESAVQRLAESLLPGEEVLPVPHGVCDSIAAGLAMPHCYFLTYVVDVTLLPPDAFAVATVSERDIEPASTDALTRYIMGGADRDVLEAPFALSTPAARLLERARRVAAEGGDHTANEVQRARFARVAGTAQAVLAGARDETDRPLVAFAAMDAVTPKVAAQQVILDEQDQMLLTRRQDTGRWAMPGGPSEVGESSAATAVRQATEQVGLDTTIAGLAGVFDERLVGGDPAVSATFVYIGRCTSAGAEPSPLGGQVTEVKWIDPGDLDRVDMEPGERAKITGALQAAGG